MAEANKIIIAKLFGLNLRFESYIDNLKLKIETTKCNNKGEPYEVSYLSNDFENNNIKNVFLITMTDSEGLIDKLRAKEANNDFVTFRDGEIGKGEASKFVVLHLLNHENDSYNVSLSDFRDVVHIVPSGKRMRVSDEYLTLIGLTPN